MKTKLSLAQQIAAALRGAADEVEAAPAAEDLATIDLEASADTTTELAVTADAETIDPIEAADTTADEPCTDCAEEAARRDELAMRIGTEAEVTSTDEDATTEPLAAETFAKYTAMQRRELAQKGQAMPDGSYPCADAEDVRNAIHAVGRGGADHDAIRKMIARNAKRVGVDVPSNWNPDGSLKAAAEADETLADDATLVADAGVITEMPAATADSPLITIDPANPGRFRSVLCVEGERTSDNRIIALNAARWRIPPLPLMLMTKTADGHDGAEVCGVIESISRQGNDIVGEGRFDTGPSGLEAARLVANKVLTGVSIDAGDVDQQVIVEAEDEMGNPTKVLRQMDSLEIGCATICPFQAIGSAKIEYVAPDEIALAASASLEALETLANDPTLERVWAEGDTVTAAAPRAFPAAFFADPQFAELTTLRVTPEGRVYGHAAPWGACHTGIPGTCVTAPRSRTSYAHFLTGSVPLEDGTFQPVGRITIDTMHANHRLGPREASMHYDHTGAVAAFVNVGEDAFGIWVSGILKPGISADMANALLGASLSGDWRKIGGNLELIGLLGVNVPGFPVAGTRKFAMDGDDEQISLVAAGYGPAQRTKQVLADQVDALGERTDERIVGLETQIADARDTIEQMRETMAPLVRDHLARRLG